jgi:prolyl oligopeptidase
LRGGGEYGDDWHKAGILQNKQRTFDDLFAVTSHLARQGYTCPEKVSAASHVRPQTAIIGGSNGGMMVLASALQRPELFRAVVSMVPVADMLRFHKFTIGHAWTTDYGCSEASVE